MRSLFRWNPHDADPPEDLVVYRGPRLDTNPRVVLWAHGTGGWGPNLHFPHQAHLWGRFLAAGQGRYVIVATGMGGVATYGNDASRASIDDTLTWIDVQGWNAERVGLAGESMGAATTVSWASVNAAKVTGICFVDGAVFPSKWYDSGIPGYQTAQQVQDELNAAYGGNWLANEAERCPKLLADTSSALRAIPLRHYLAGDGSEGNGIKVIPDEDAATFDTSWGANAELIQPSLVSDHSSVHSHVDPVDLLAWFDNLNWS